MGFPHRARRPAIRALLTDSGALAHAGLIRIELETHGPLGPPAAADLPLLGPGLQATFRCTLAHPPARARGVVRLAQDGGVGGAWKAYTLYTALTDFVGHEAATARARPAHDGVSWAARRAAEEAALEADLTVLIVGAGHSGLIAAACLRQLGLRALVIERNARVGDNWRNRYPTLALHTPAHMTTLPYMPWPSTWPDYIPAVKVGDFLEAYATNLDLHVWTASQIVGTPARDAASGRWTVQVARGDTHAVLRPKHIVLSIGLAAGAREFRPPGMDTFRGTVYASGAHRGAAGLAGKRVLVVGACNSAADIAQDCAEHGAHVTMLQRSVTCVMSLAASERVHVMQFPHDREPGECDFVNASTPTNLVMQLLSGGGTAFAKTLDKSMHDGLEKAGFGLGFGEQYGKGEIGLYGLIVHRAGGYFVDVGCSRLIVEGKIKMKRGTEVERFEPDGVVCKDGTKIEADVVVSAIGYETMRDIARRVFGAEVVDQTSEVWNLDAEGELRGVWRPSGCPGLWYASCDFPTSRYLSKFLGLQILAQELGYKQ